MRLTCLVFASVGLATLGRVAQGAPLVYERFENSAVGTISGGVTFSTDVIGPVVDYGTGPVANEYTAVFDGVAGTFVNHGTATQVTSTDFTVEALINLSAAPNYQMIASDWQQSTSDVWSFIVTDTGGLRFDVSHTGQYISGNALYSAAGLIEANKWYHVAAVKEGTTSRIYVDGALVATNASLADPGVYTGDVGNLKVGNVDSWGGGSLERPFVGRLDEVRITQSALSPSAFLKAAPTPVWVRAEDGTPGTAAGTVLNSGFGADGTAHGGVSYSSDVAVSGIVMPWLVRSNAVSLAFDGNTGSYVEFDSTVDVEPGPDGGFTVEAFVRLDQLGGYQVIGAEWKEAADRVWALAVQGDGSLRFDTSPNGNYYSGNKADTGSITIGDGKWHHVAGVYDGAVNRIYVDYELAAEQTLYVSGLYEADNALLRIGDAEWFAGGHANFGGLIDEFRITAAVLGPEDFLRVPEPGSLALLAVGLVGLLVWRRRG